MAPPQFGLDCSKGSKLEPWKSGEPEMPNNFQKMLYKANTYKCKQQFKEDGATFVYIPGATDTHVFNFKARSKTLNQERIEELKINSPSLQSVDKSFKPHQTFGPQKQLDLHSSKKFDIIKSLNSLESEEIHEFE